MVTTVEIHEESSQREKKEQANTTDTQEEKMDVREEVTTTPTKINEENDKTEGNKNHKQSSEPDQRGEDVTTQQNKENKINNTEQTNSFLANLSKELTESKIFNLNRQTKKIPLKESSNNSNTTTINMNTFVKKTYANKNKTQTK